MSQGEWSCIRHTRRPGKRGNRLEKKKKNFWNRSLHYNIVSNQATFPDEQKKKKNTASMELFTTLKVYYTFPAMMRHICTLCTYRLVWHAPIAVKRFQTLVRPSARVLILCTLNYCITLYCTMCNAVQISHSN